MLAASPGGCHPIACLCVVHRLAPQDVRMNAYVYVNDQSWSGFSKKRKTAGCSTDGGM